jgi:hypothetical protein
MIKNRLILLAIFIILISELCLAYPSNTPFEGLKKIYSAEKVNVYVNIALLHNLSFYQYKEENCFNVDLLIEFIDVKMIIKIMKEGVKKSPDLYVYLDFDEFNNIRYLVEEVEFDCENLQVTTLKETAIDSLGNTIVWRAYEEVHPIDEKDSLMFFKTYQNLIRYFDSLINNS